MNKPIYYFCIIGLLIMVSTTLSGQTVTFSAKTVTDNGTYSPNHVLAIWVEDNSGNFVKTLKLSASKRIQYLYTWNSKSGGNVVDAVTGASLTQHATHTVQWNGTNASRQPVPSGNYKIVMEFTDQHFQGPVFSFTFPLVNSVQQFQPPDQTYFKSISFSLTPVVTTIDPVEQNSEFLVYPNPNSGHFYLKTNASSIQNNLFNIYDPSGKQVFSGHTDHQKEIKVEIPGAGKGIYLLELKQDRNTQAVKVIVN